MERESSWQQQSRVKSVPKDYPKEMEPLPEQSTKKDGRKLEDDEESDWEDMQEEPLNYWSTLYWSCSRCWFAGSWQPDGKDSVPGAVPAEYEQFYIIRLLIQKSKYSQT